MTISTENRKAGPFNGNGSASVFPFAFKVFNSADLVVVVRDDATAVETTLVLTSGYTVSLNADQNASPGGSVTLVAGALATGKTLVISSSLQYLQPTDLTNQGGFYPKVITNALDRLTIFCQQLAQSVKGSFRLPITADSDISTELPIPEANKIVGWDSTAKKLRNVGAQELATISSYGTTNADQFTGDGSQVSFVLSASPGSVNNMDVSVSGVTLRPDHDYTWDAGTTITFTSAPAAPSVSGEKNILVRYNVALPNLDTGPIADAISDHEAKAGAHPISGVLGLQAALDAISEPVLAPKWMRKRSAMWAGYAPEDGQLLSRALYPDAWASIQAGAVPVCTDAEWLADPAKRGCFTPGDGSTTFRVPDTNGVQPGSYGPVYPSGGSGDGGAILRDRIQNITGELNGIYGELAKAGETSKGAFSPKASTSGSYKAGSGAAWETANTLASFDASRVARTGDTTRPITVEGCWAVRLFGAVQNTGSADAAALATAVAGLTSRITTLEQATTLVNAAGQAAALGFVRETVSATLPANLAINTRYSITNPFGATVPVKCTLYLYVNSKWSEVDGSMAALSTGYGAKAFYVPGEGVVIQTGRTGLMSVSTDTLSGHANTTATITSAPAVVHLERMPV
jgi:hypothetical protein